MYSFSHNHKIGWRGKFATPQEALTAGRAAYGSDTRIYVGRWKQAMYSDMFIGAKALISYMKEDAVEMVGDEHVEAFDSLLDEDIESLNQYLVTSLGEWESELPEERQFTGMHIENVRGYSELEEVRRAHFA